MKTIITIICIFSLILLSCEEVVEETVANPWLNFELHKITSDPISIDEDTYTSFEDKFDLIEKETELIVENMSGEQIVDAARYLGYFGREWEAIRIYETALQNENYQWSLVFHHNLGRLYDEVGETKKAISRYRYLVHIGHRNYQKDIDRIESRKKK